MAEVILKKKQVEVLKVTIEDKTYSIPLGGSLPYKTLKKLKSEDGTFEFLQEYIPEEVIDDLTSNDIAEILRAWTKATEENTGLKSGES